MTDDAVTRFEAALAAHGPLVHRVCRAMLADAQAGDDAAQETFLRLWNALRRGEGPRQPGAWLRRAAASASIDALRRRRLLPALGLDVESQEATAPGAGLAPASASPLDAVASLELATRLRRAVVALSPLQRTTFLLRHEAGLPLPEIAALLGVTLSTAKTHFARATLRLRPALAPFLPGETLS